MRVNSAAPSLVTISSAPGPPTGSAAWSTRYSIPRRRGSTTAGGLSGSAGRDDAHLGRVKGGRRDDDQLAAAGCGQHQVEPLVVLFVDQLVRAHRCADGVPPDLVRAVQLVGYEVEEVRAVAGPCAAGIACGSTTSGSSRPVAMSVNRSWKISAPEVSTSHASSRLSGLGSATWHLNIAGRRAEHVLVQQQVGSAWPGRARNSCRFSAPVASGASTGSRAASSRPSPPPRPACGPPPRETARRSARPAPAVCAS